MAFIRTKTIGGRTYVYVVESFRDRTGATRQRTLEYLGATDPVHGRRGPIDVRKEKLRLRKARSA